MILAFKLIRNNSQCTDLAEFSLVASLQIKGKSRQKGLQDNCYIRDSTRVRLLPTPYFFLLGRGQCGVLCTRNFQASSLTTISSGTWRVKLFRGDFTKSLELMGLRDKDQYWSTACQELVPTASGEQQVSKQTSFSAPHCSHYHLNCVPPILHP